MWKNWILAFCGILCLALGCDNIEEHRITENYTWIRGSKAAQDIDSLLKAFKKYHAGLHHYVSEEELDHEFLQLADKLNQMDSLTQVECYNHFTELVAKIQCSQTVVTFPQEFLVKRMKTEHYFPLEFRFIDGKPFILENLSQDTTLKEGIEVLAINNMEIDPMIDSFLSRLSSDGQNESYKYQVLEKNFRYYHHNTYGQYDLYFIRAKLPNLEEPVNFLVPSVNRQAIAAFRKRNVLTGKPLDTLWIPEKELAVLSIGSFDQNRLTLRGLAFNQFMDQFFEELASRNTKKLVLDLRESFSEDTNNGIRLLKYLLGRPFQLFESVTLKGDVAPDMEASLTPNGLLLVEEHPGKVVATPFENRFSGEIVVLTSGRTRGTAHDVAALLEGYPRAKFAGEETGNACGSRNTGMKKIIVLQNSGLQVSIPQLHLALASPNCEPLNRGILPDFPIATPVLPIQAAQDSILTATLEWFAP